MLIPVINTEAGKFEYDGNLTAEAYSNMEYQKYVNTNSEMNEFVDNIQYGVSNMGNVRRRAYWDSENDGGVKTGQIYEFYEAEVFVQDVNKNDIDASFFEPHKERQDMFILMLNINPNTLDNNAESELKFWIDDSERTFRDESLDDDTKLRALPTRSPILEIDGEKYVLSNSKIVQNFSDRKWPFYFAIIVEKIEKEYGRED